MSSLQSWATHRATSSELTAGSVSSPDKLMAIVSPIPPRCTLPSGRSASAAPNFMPMSHSSFHESSAFTSCEVLVRRCTDARLNGERKIFPVRSADHGCDWRPSWLCSRFSSFDPHLLVSSVDVVFVDHDCERKCLC